MGEGMKRAFAAAKATRINPAHILLETHLRELDLPFEREFQFCLDRKWRLDYFLPGPSVGIEIMGGFYRGKSGHSSINGLQRDYDKSNRAEMSGIRMLHFSTADVLRGKAKKFLEEHLSR